MFTLGALLLFIILIFFHTDSAMTQDLGRHLTLGKIIWETKTIPHTNYFSYTYPEFPVLNHHWGSQVVFYLLHQAVNIEGLILVKVIILVFSYWLLVVFTVKRADYLFTIAAGILSMEIFRERTEIRPEIFAYILYTLFLLILYKNREKGNKWIFILPLLSILWVNLHISFILAPAVFFIFIVDRFLNKKINYGYLLTGIFIIAALFINPFGIKGLVYPLNIFNNYGYQIVENQTPFFLEKVMNNPTILYFKTAGLLFLPVIPLLLVKKYFFEVGCVVLTGIMSATAVRHFPFFALSLIYPFALGLTVIKDKLINIFRTGKNNIQGMEIIFNFVLITVLTWEIYSLASNSYYLSKFSSTRSGTGQVKGMRETVNFIEKNRIGGPVFNNFDIGSYLIYRLHPREKVFIDGRPEAYPAAFFQEVYIPMQEKEEIWKKTDDQYKFKTIIFGHTDGTPWGRQFISTIVKNNNWQIVYFDDYGIILVKKEGNSPMKLQGYDIKDMGLKLIQIAKESDELMRLGNLFNLIGQPDLESLAKIKAVTIVH